MQREVVSFTAVLMLLFFNSTHRTYAQYNTKRNMVWAFGFHAGLDFNSGAPVPISTGLSVSEGTASVCDVSGNLLFYTCGDTIWNKLHNKMPNGIGTSLYTCNSTSQGAVIVQSKANTNRYYVFSLSEWPDSHLSYSEVDMTLNGGLGDVVPASKATLIGSDLSEKMISVKGSGDDVWVLVHKEVGHEFYAYKVNSSGIAPPVVSNVGTNAYYSVGTMKVSPDRSKLALMVWSFSLPYLNVELFDFNASTGTVSNCRPITVSYPVHGGEFSPDSKKLYVSDIENGDLMQYDVSLPTRSAIEGSKYVVVSNLSYLGDLRLAPDGKIYFGRYNSICLNRINFPNLAGASCGYADSVVTLTGGVCAFGMPNVFWSESSSAVSDPVAGLEPVIYPNPARDNLTVEVPPTNEEILVEILDLFGRTKTNFKSGPGSKIDMDVSDLPPGNYIINVTAAGATYRSKVSIGER